MYLLRKSIFLHYTNDSTLTLLRNGLFNINKQNIVFIVIKPPKGGDKVMKRVSQNIQCSMTYCICLILLLPRWNETAAKSYFVMMTRRFLRITKICMIHFCSKCFDKILGHYN